MFHEKFGTPTRVSISTTCFVHPFALLLFGGSMEVQHLERKVLVDEWIEIGMAAQTGVMMREVRDMVNGLLQNRIQAVGSGGEQRSADSGSIDSIMLDGIIKLLQT